MSNDNFRAAAAAAEAAGASAAEAAEKTYTPDTLALAQSSGHLAEAVRQLALGLAADR